MFKGLFPQTKFWLFSRKSNNFSEKRNSHLETTRYPVVKVPPKPELTKDLRKQIVSRLLLLVKEDSLKVELKRRVLIYDIG
jgi:hypothetical protein